MGGNGSFLGEIKLICSIDTVLKLPKSQMFAFPGASLHSSVIFFHPLDEGFAVGLGLASVLKNLGFLKFDPFCAVFDSFACCDLLHRQLFGE